MMTKRFGYTGEEKARIRRGLQCPECFGVNTEPRFTVTSFQCRDCGAQWHASTPEFQGQDRPTIHDEIKTR